MLDAIILAVEPEAQGLRIDKFISLHRDELTRSAVQRLIEEGCVQKNGIIVSKSCNVHAGDRISIIKPQPKETELVAQNIPLDVRYEDGDLLVVNKPKGMVVHPACGNEDETLVNALLYYCKGELSGINGEIRPGIVHRIDKDTSGLLIVAKNDFAHVRLAEQIKEHSFTRMYQCVVYGRFKTEGGTVDAPIGRHPNDRKKMAVTQKNSRNAVTHYEVVQGYSGFTHLKVRLETGRTHQIRVHMAYIGHPVAGDSVYGPKKCITELNGQCLHAGLVGFVHPRSGEYIEIESELPQYFTSFLDKINKEG